MNINSQFDRKARQWDTPERISRSEAVAQAIEYYIKLQPDFTVLDLGCGTGQLSFLLHGKVKQLIGIDNSEGMLQVFNEKLAENQYTDITSMHHDLSRPELDLPESNLIISEMTWHHIPKAAEMIHTCYKSLLPGGALAIADLDAEQGDFHSDNSDVAHFGFSGPQMKQYFTDAGFTQVQQQVVFTISKAVDGQTKDYPVLLTLGYKA